jgi:hypothetical protein
MVQVITVRDETATWDEPLYLAAGYSYWTTGRYEINPEHPPLAKLLCSLPLYAMYPLRLGTQSAEWKKGDFVMAGNLFLYRNTVPPDDLLFAGRLVTIGLTLLFGMYLAWWTRRRFGAGAGLFVVALFAFDPNIVAHGRYVTNDLCVSLFIFTTCTLWMEYLISGEWRWLALTGLNLGLAFASKYSALYLPVALVAMAVAWRWREFRRVVWVGPVVLLSLFVVAVVYSPEIARSSELPPLATAISRAGATGPLLSFFAGRLHAPAYTFLTGIDWQSRHNSTGHPAYLLGQVSTMGWWYYFPVVFAVKTAAATLAGILLALLLLWRSERRRILAVLLLPAAAYFGLTMLSHIDLGVRSLLPVYPLLYVAMGAVLLERRRLRWAALAVAVLAAVESAAVYPSYLAFFNVLAGGPDAGPKYLLDSNLDWGQDFKKLGRYLNANGIQSIRLGFFANVDFPHYGIHAESIPDGATADNLDCVLAISATPLFGQYVGLERFAWLRERRPMAIIGHSIYVYDLRKPVHGAGLVLGPGLQFGGREVGVIRRVGIMLRLQTQRRPLGIGLASLAG